ncbi:HNH endonuclease [uncultured Sphingomonas sp.]|uniref:HNH endonuclease n=1 Tax=uncultured Sphingomonas sp. TaxID=158754 RepID=UPI00261CB296|nr:HNH endonuclease [uncultured Sphingomonas sp.]
MHCLICLEERPRTVERVFPLDIGGSLTTDRLCVDCNSLLRRTADTALSKLPFVAFERSRFVLRGNSGKVAGRFAVVLE